MAAATAAQIKTRLAAVLKFPLATQMPSYYDELCAAGETYGYQFTLATLLNRGFRQIEDIDPWPRLFEFTMDLGTWKALMLSGSYAEHPKEVMEGEARQKELLDCHVFDALNRWVKPQADGAGVVRFGGVINQNSGVFRYDESDPDLGIQI